MATGQNLTNRLIAPEPPNQPLAPADYERAYHDQHSNVLRLFFNRLSVVLSTLFGTQGGRYLNNIHGAFSDNTDQADGALNVAYYIRFDTTDFSNGVSVQPHTASFTGSIAATTLTVTAVATGTLLPSMLITGAGVLAGTHIVEQLTGTSGGVGTYRVSTAQTVVSTAITGTLASKIVVTQDGLYNFQFSVQLINTTNDVQNFVLWFRKNGVDVPASASDFGIAQRKSTGTSSRTIAALNFFLELQANDYVELMWHVSDPGVSIEHFAAKTAGPTNPNIPAVPSVILTVSYVSNPL